MMASFDELGKSWVKEKLLLRVLIDTSIVILSAAADILTSDELR